MSLLTENIGSPQSSFTFGGMQVFGPGSGSGAAGALPGAGGSSGGVPDNASVSGDAENMTQVAAKSKLQYGASTAGRPAWDQPALWAVVSVFLGIFVLAHTARLHVQGG